MQMLVEKILSPLNVKRDRKTAGLTPVFFLLRCFLQGTKEK